MNEKKLNLINKGLSLMAESGYYKTSIQQIASSAGISKGSFYLYFQSKEDFMVTSIEHIHDKVNRHLLEYSQSQNDPKEALASQIAILMEYIKQYKWFILMYMNESISIGNRMDALISKIEEANFGWLQKSITSIYGDNVRHVQMDAMIQLEGLLSSYCKWIILYNISIDQKQIGGFIVRRLDNLVNGMLANEERPLITQEHLSTMKQQKQMSVQNLLATMDGKIESLPISKKKREQLTEVVHTLQKKEQNEDTNPIVLQGLLAHFNPYPVLHNECEKLAKLWSIDLL